MTTPTFSPPINPSFPVSHSPEWREDGFRSVKGYDQGVVHGPRSLDSIPLIWKVVTGDELDEILSFFDSLNGATGPFFWTPIDNVRNPLGMTPVLGQVAGGSLVSQGTYFVQFTWYDTSSGGETKGSKQASFAVSDNFLLTVNVPVFPLAVSEWRVYVGVSSGDCELQAGTETTRTWTMPGSGRVAGGANPPAADDLTLPLLWKHDGRPQYAKIGPDRYQLTMTFFQQTAI